MLSFCVCVSVFIPVFSVFTRKDLVLKSTDGYGVRQVSHFEKQRYCRPTSVQGNVLIS